MGMMVSTPGTVVAGGVYDKLRIQVAAKALEIATGSKKADSAAPPTMDGMSALANETFPDHALASGLFAVTKPETFVDHAAKVLVYLASI